MKIKLSKMNGKYGAPMGRHNSHIQGKCHLQKIPLDSGGYDQGGAYWGLGEPLYCAQDAEWAQLFLRATSREDAKRKLDEHPLAHDLEFYR